MPMEYIRADESCPFSDVVVVDGKWLFLSGLISEDLDSGEVVLSGHCRVEANSSCKINALRMSSGEQKMYLIRWQGKDIAGVNHYLQGTAPFAPERYANWLKKLQSLPEYK